MKDRKWWKQSVFYQVYPKSFLDTDGDGIGNINGITRRLDYLKDLGINAVWVCPVYCSPMKDNGYDISDYYGIQPEFGTLEDVKELIREADKRKIRIIMDLVVNHCSDRHAWFQSVKADPESPYRDYFIIRKGGKDGAAPNNWRSVFGGSVWEPLGDGEYYYHTFSKEQPDLNWECERMRKEIYEMMRYWLDLGISGFRIDAITFIKKDPSFRSLKPDGPDGLAGLGEVSENYPGIEDFLAEMKRETYGRYDAFSVAEISRVGDEMMEKMAGENGVFDSIFDFSYLDLDVVDGQWYKRREITAGMIKECMAHSQTHIQACGGLLSVVLENHDQNRSLNKYLKKAEDNFPGASMLATWNLTLRGVPFLYQGEEIGMTNRSWESMEEFDDISTKGQYKTAVEAGVSEEEGLEICSFRSRDNARTPMQWDDRANAGFSDHTPWLPVNENYRTVNVRSQEEDPHSILNYYRKLIRLRRSGGYSEVLSFGEISFIEDIGENLIGYRRTTEDKALTVLLNFGDRCEPWPAAVPAGMKKILGNYDTDQESGKGLRPYEALILEG